MAQLAGTALVTFKTWVQIPGLANAQYYFSKVVPMRFSNVGVPCTLIINMPRSLGGQSEGWKLKNTYAWSNAPYGIWRSQRIKLNWARLFKSIPPFGA